MIVFSKMNEPEHKKDINKYGIRIEYYSDDPHEQMFPVGIAYAIEIPELKAAQLNFIMVADQWRRRGIATEIIKACQLKWPNIQFTDGMDYRGRNLLKKFGW